jgi:hypothetical protein
MKDYPAPNHCRYFNELAALAHSGTLMDGETVQLKEHLQACDECRGVYQQYLLLAREGIPLLAGRYANQDQGQVWDEDVAWARLLARVQAVKRRDGVGPAAPLWDLLQSNLLGRPVAWALAVCFVVLTGLVTYRLETHTQILAKQLRPRSENSLSNRPGQSDSSADDLLRSDATKILKLQEEISRRDQEITNLRAMLRPLKTRTAELASANDALNVQLRTISEQRDALRNELRDAERSNQETKAQLAGLRSERDSQLLRTASLESKVDELSAANRDQERRLQDDEQFLASDRDIRELMGARKLYIADVFDVDSGSHTQKRFGRIFYTQGKSLLFYAFDLDRPNAGAFQAWGRRDADDKKPLNLGIFYKDSETNHRWVLRFDDPKQLAEIDSVFVTIEPNGGSKKPTGKCFLYALLREPANHP